jgi:hypothetical protein
MPELPGKKDQKLLREGHRATARSQSAKKNIVSALILELLAAISANAEDVLIRVITLMIDISEINLLLLNNF